jgi:hypothetical protein
MPARWRLVAAGMAGLLAVAASPAGAPLRELRWLAPGTDRVAALTRRPAECLKWPATADGRYTVEVGRIAFRTPMLLGGQAARVGLRCESCHRNGRTNPAFSFPGLSGGPGTADVTSALFSTRRDDGIDNPVPIPDLGGDKAHLHVDQSSATGALPAFIHGLVVDEFNGSEPPAAVLAGLAAYVRAMDPAGCGGDEAVTVDDNIADARRAVRLAMEALRRLDRPTAVLMVEGARWQLGLIDERYALPALDAERALLRDAALDLTAALPAIRDGDPRAGDALAAWLGRSPAWALALDRAEPGSLYAPAVLQRRLTAPASR